MLPLVFMGTAPFAVPCLEALAAAEHRVLAVVTQPDRPAGRRRRPQASAVKTAALALELPLLQPEKASDPEFVDRLRALEPALIVVVAYGQILRPAVLAIPRLGCVNVHASLLPKYRGAAPIQRALMAGEAETGVCTMLMDAGMDTGPLLRVAREPIRPEDTAGDLGARLSARGASLLVETVAELAAGRLSPSPQDDSQATLAPRIQAEDAVLHWADSAVALRNRLHACNPRPGAVARRAGRRVKLWRAEITPTGNGGKLGEVLAVDDRGIVIQTGVGALRVLEAQTEGRRRQPAAEFARGQRVAVGEQWADGDAADNE